MARTVAVAAAMCVTLVVSHDVLRLPRGGCAARHSAPDERRGAEPDSRKPWNTEISASFWAVESRRSCINSALFDRIHRLPMPVIGLLDGFALGGGAERAYACNFRIGTPRLRIGNPEPGLGILAARRSDLAAEGARRRPVAKEILLAGPGPGCRGGAFPAAHQRDRRA